VLELVLHEMVVPIGLIIGTAAAGLYNWASSVYTYNRDAWMTDMQLDQARAYQMDNLRIAMKNMDREEIRDLMQSDIGRINNVIIITTLILSLAGEMLFEARIPEDCAAFVLNAYMLCLGSAIMNLVLAILFGMYASNEAYATSTRMLTSDIRPLWGAHFQKMKRRQKQEFTKSFDQGAMGAMFMPPLASRLKMAVSGSKSSCARQPRSASKDKGDVELAQVMHPDAVGDFQEELDVDQELWANDPNHGYRDAWQEVGQQTWQQFKGYSFQCAAFGTKNLLEACGYLCIARLYGSNRDAWAFWAIQAIFITLNVVMMQFLVGRNSITKGIVVGTGPFSCALAATTSYEIVDRICIPLCYFCHLVVTIFLFFQSPSTGVGGTVASQDTDAKSGSGAVQETTYVFSSGGACCGCIEQELASPTDVVDLQQHLQSEMSELARQVSPELARQLSPRPDVPLGVHNTTNVVIPQLMLRRGLSVVALLWTSAFFWALYGSIWGMDFKNDVAMIPDFSQALEVADLTQVPVVFPSPYFKPHALVCPRGKIFLADRYRVFQLMDDDSVKPYPCEVNATIADLAAQCDVDGCWPLVLLGTSPPTVYDCSTREQKTLLQTKEAVKRFSTPTDEPGHVDTLYAAKGAEVVQYQWQKHRLGWVPFWDIAAAGADLQAIDVVDNHLLLFSEAGTVEAQDLKTGLSCGVWAMPPTLMGAGCGVRGMKSILILVRNRKDDVQKHIGMNTVSVMEARLPGAQSACGIKDQAETEETLPWSSGLGTFNMSLSAVSTKARSLRG